MLTLNEILDQLHVCSEARQWAATQPDARTAWCNCPRGDRLIWLAGMLGIDRKTIAAAVCDCVELALPFVIKHNERPRNAITVTRARLAGEATLEDLRAAAAAADDAADAAWAKAAWADAAWAKAASAAAAAAEDVTWTAASATAAVAWTVAAAPADARSDVLKQCADIVRSRITWEQIADGIENTFPSA